MVEGWELRLDGGFIDLGTVNFRQNRLMCTSLFPIGKRKLHSFAERKTLWPVIGVDMRTEGCVRFLGVFGWLNVIFELSLGIFSYLEYTESGITLERWDNAFIRVLLLQVAACMRFCLHPMHAWRTPLYLLSRKRHLKLLFCELFGYAKERFGFGGVVNELGYTGNLR